MSRRKKLSSSTTESFQAFSAQSQPPLLPTPPPQAYVAQSPQSFGFSSHRGRNTYRGNHYHNPGRYNNNRGHRGTYRGQSSNRGHPQGVRHSSFSSNRAPCQICGSTSHEAIDCYDRMNPDFSGKIPPAKLAAMCAHYTSKPSPSWLLDSGATTHITNDIANISSPTPYTGEDKVYVGDGNGLSIHHIGSSSLHSPHAKFHLSNVLHVPQMKHNLLSAYQFLKDNYCALTLDSDGSVVKDRTTGRTLLQGPVKDGFYPLLDCSSTAPSSGSSFAFVSAQGSVKLWHSRLGHPSSSIFRKIISSTKLAIKGTSSVDFFCSKCAIAKNHKLPFSSSTTSTSQSLELLHCDLWGPASVTSGSGFRYYFLIVDDFSKYSWCFPLKTKSEVYSTFVIFKAYVENIVGNKIKILRSDSGGEFTSLQFKVFLHTHGIVQQLSCPHTPEQNGCVERKHRHLVETARTLLVESSVPHSYWVEAFTTAIYLINRLPISGNTKSPWELVFRKSPDYSKLKVFGCSCYPWLKPYISSKLDGKSKRCVFLGYSLQHKGYRCLDLETNRIYVSRHVTFDEDTFPFKDVSSVPSSVDQSLSPSSSINLHFSIPPSPPSVPVLLSTPLSSSSQPAVPPHSISPPASVPTHHPVSPNHSELSHPPVPPPVSNVHPMVTRSKNGIHKPKAFTATKHPLPSSTDYIPNTYLQASKFENWRLAMQNEFNALLSTGTWTLVPPSPSHNVVGCKWVFRIKKNPDGSIERYKARLVAKGFHQKEGLDYTETFSPVAKPVTIRLLLSFAVQFNWFLNQLDISNAFLHGDLNEDVFMVQPPGFQDPSRPTHVCKLRKSLYGLKQAPRAWFDKLFHALLSLGFSQSSSDASLFVLHAPTLVIVLVYVDDILVSGPDATICNQFIAKLSTLFPVKDLGPLHYFLGLEVHRTKDTLILHQNKYLLDLLQKTNMTGAKPCCTPLSSTKLDHSGELLANPTEYRSLVGALQYLTWTRPDISFAVNQICQFMHTPTVLHMQAAKRILRFLKGTIAHGLLFRKSSLHLSAYSDADWAGCSYDRRSTGGSCVFLGTNLVSWSAKKQSTVARSSTEAEYRSLAHTAAEVTWICKVLKDFGFPISHKPTLWCDNISAISLASNPVFHARTKHVEIDYHYIRELVLAHLVEVKYVCSQSQIADIHTKALSKTRFQFLQSKLSLGILDSSKFGLRGCKDEDDIS